MEIKPERRASFEKSWKDLTLLIYEYAGSLGSRLHKADDYNYVAYAQWPSKEAWVSAKDKLPETSNRISQLMKDSCKSFETLYELEVVEDLLKSKT